MTALENIELPIDNKLSNKEKIKRAENLLIRVGLKIEWIIYLQNFKKEKNKK